MKTQNIYLRLTIVLAGAAFLQACGKGGFEVRELNVSPEVASFASADTDTSPLVSALSTNSACDDLFSQIDPEEYSPSAEATIRGWAKDVVTAKVEKLSIYGVSRSIAAKAIGTLRIAGIHGSICVQAREVRAIDAYIHGNVADIALIGPEDGTGIAGEITGYAGSDMVIANYDVESIMGKGRALHVFGGRIQELKGVFDEIHLYDGAKIDDMKGINKGVFIH